MQLALTSFQKKGQTIMIDDPRIVRKYTNVLRMSVGDHILVQQQGIRYEVSLTKITPHYLEGTILSHLQSPIGLGNTPHTTIAIALPNKLKICSLIVQKLTEIGISQIVFWKGQYSQSKDLTDKQLQKLKHIALHASEQAKQRSLPTITCNTILSDLLEQHKRNEIVVFDNQQDHQSSPLDEKPMKQSQNYLGIIGPEGGFGPQDYEQLISIPHRVQSLGTSILKMETAAIIGGWVLQQECQLEKPIK